MHLLHKVSLLLFVLNTLLLPLETSANNDTNRFEHYRKVFSKLHKNYLNAPEDVANIAALAYFYSEPDNPMRNLPLAMDYIKISETQYRKLIDDKKRYRDVNKLIKKGFTIVELRQRRKMISDEARNYVKNGLQPNETDAFMRAFADDKVIIKELSKQKSKHSCDNAIELNTEKAYKEYLDNPSNTYNRTTIVENLKTLLKRKISVASTELAVDEIVNDYDYPEIKNLAEERKCEINYNIAITKNTAETYKAFLQRYPNSDKYKIILNFLDSLAYYELSTLRTPRQYADFAIKYSELTPGKQAVDSLIALAVNKKDKQALNIYLKEFSNDAHYNEVYKSYYLRYSSEGNVAPILLFDSLNPNFPLKSLITDDLKIAKEIDKIPFLIPFDETKTVKNVDLLKKYMGKDINYVLLQRLLQPHTSKANWKKALALMNKYEFCFDNNQNQYYNELKQILSENVKNKPTTIYAPHYDISHPQLSTTGVIYSNKITNHNTQVLAINQTKNQSTETEVIFDNNSAKDITFFSLSADENNMLVGQKGDIFMAVRSSNGWELSDLEAEDLNTILYYEGDASLTPDGMGLLFISDRPEGYNVNISGSLFHGDTALATDIYYMPRTSNGWGKPINLGPVVNTPFSERSPVLSRDLITLYFTSDRNGGMGFYDIWMTTRTNPNSWTEWSTPVNIGKFTNTSFSEPTISLSPNEDYIYFTTNSSNLHRYNISRCKSKHKNTLFYRTVSINCQQINNPDNLTIDVRDISTGILVHHYQPSDSVTFFKFDVFANKNYFVKCNMNGFFLPIIFLSNEEPNAVPNAFEIKTCIANKVHIPLNTIIFEDNTSELTPSSQYEIYNIVQLLKKNQNIKIEIINNVINNDINLSYNLSLQRSEAIKNALLRHNIDSKRIVASGYGNVNYKKNSATTAVEIILFE